MQFDEKGLEVIFRPDPTLFDGRFANNAWLQELPKPLSKITWDNAVYLSPRTARELGLGSQGSEHTLGQVVSLSWFERARLRYRLRCNARGVFTIGPVLVRTGDPFGFAGREATLPVYDQVLVYPRIVPIERCGW